MHLNISRVLLSVSSITTDYIETNFCLQSQSIKTMFKILNTSLCRESHTQFLEIIIFRFFMVVRFTYTFVCKMFSSLLFSSYFKMHATFNKKIYFLRIIIKISSRIECRMRYEIYRKKCQNSFPASGCFILASFPYFWSCRKMGYFKYA